MSWRFDTNNPYEDVFEESLLRTVDSARLLAVVERECVRILRDPKANEVVVLHGRPLYIAKTAKRLGEHAVGPLLIVYALSEREKLVRRVLVCKAVDEVTGSTLAERRVNAASNDIPVMTPSEKTSIPKSEIAKAVEDTRARRRKEHS